MVRQVRRLGHPGLVGLTSAGSLGDQGGKRERAAYAVHPKGWRNAMRDVIMESFRKGYVQVRGRVIASVAWHGRSSCLK